MRPIARNKPPAKQFEYDKSNLLDRKVGILIGKRPKIRVITHMDIIPIIYVASTEIAIIII